MRITSQLGVDEAVLLVDMNGAPVGTVANPLAISGGGGGAVTVADGADVAEGATTDGAVTTDSNGTISGKLRGLVKILASVWDSANGRLKVDSSAVTQPVSGTFWQATQPVSGKVTANAGSGTFAIQATAGAPAAVELSDGAAFYVGAKTGQLPAALVGGRLSVDGSGVTQPVSGTFWQATQPVSGTVTASQGGSPWNVQGQQAAGAAITENPVVIAGQNAGNVKLLALDASGQLTTNQGTLGVGGASGWFVQGQSAAAATLAGNPVSIAGSDGSVVRTLLVSAAGRASVDINSGTVTATESRPGSATTVIDLLSATDAGRVLTILAANTSRRGATIRNDTDMPLKIMEGGNASLTAYTDIVPPGARYVLDYPASTALLTAYLPQVPGGQLTATERS